MRIVTCNIRYFGGADAENHWTHRRGICIDVIRAQEPDVICCQEVWREQMDDLEAGLPEFAAYGIPDEPMGSNPMNPIFYRKAAFGCVGQAGYWLSETPHVAGSSSWDSACVRLANWVRLVEVASGASFRVVNTHLDHVSQVAREEQARLIDEDAAAYGETYPQLLTGDMNCDQRNAAMEVFRQGGWVDTYAAIHGPKDPGPTYHAFQGQAFVSQLGKMDWILARGQIQVTAAAVITEQRDGRFPSDHYFVSADVGLDAHRHGTAD